eukprot:5360009-Prymnesium_polylepis.2
MNDFLPCDPALTWHRTSKVDPRRGVGNPPKRQDRCAQKNFATEQRQVDRLSRKHAGSQRKDDACARVIDGGATHAFDRVHEPKGW